MAGEASREFEKRLKASQYPEGVSRNTSKSVVTNSKGSASDTEDEAFVCRMAGSGRLDELLGFTLINGARKKRKNKSVLWLPVSVIVTQPG